MDRHPGRPGLFGRVQPARHRPDRTADAFVHGKQRLAAVRGEDGHYLGVRDRRSDDGDFPLHRACGRWLRRASHLILWQRRLAIRRQGRGGLADRDGGPKSVRWLVFHHRPRLRRSAAYCLLRQRQHNPPIRRARQRDVGHFDNRWQRRCRVGREPRHRSLRSRARCLLRSAGRRAPLCDSDALRLDPRDCGHGRRGRVVHKPRGGSRRAPSHRVLRLDERGPQVYRGGHRAIRPDASSPTDERAPNNVGGGDRLLGHPRLRGNPLCDPPRGDDHVELHRAAGDGSRRPVHRHDFQLDRGPAVRVPRGCPIGQRDRHGRRRGFRCPPPASARAAVLTLHRRRTRRGRIRGDRNLVLLPEEEGGPRPDH